MKKTILAFATVLLASSVFAQQSKELGSEAVSAANLVKHGVVRNCIDQVEKERKGILEITKILKNEVEDLTTYEISGVLLQGGDVAIGSATLEVVGSIQPFLGMTYTCKVK